MLALKIESLYKDYRLDGMNGRRLLIETLFNGLNRYKSTGSVKNVLIDINLDVERGERIGLLGKNGAGKSTLLKIISRVTSPTRGRVVVNGRLTSLLEVGTGFHPELTGLENIFLNGGILGMNRLEIKRRLDEIVDFSEVGEYINIPVKKYSSGMYVKLAFSVATHLESDTIILDEVLSVGDMAFQEKSRRKMEEITQGGKTVIFVSHAVGSIKAICNKAAIIDSGRISQKYNVQDGLNHYLGIVEEIIKNKKKIVSEIEDKVVGEFDIKLAQSDMLTNVFDYDLDISVTLSFNVKRLISGLCIGYRIINPVGETLVNQMLEFKDVFHCDIAEPGNYCFVSKIPKSFLVEGRWSIVSQYKYENLPVVELKNTNDFIILRPNSTTSYPKHEPFGWVTIDPNWRAI